jgi:YbbR domain-containing protein
VIPPRLPLRLDEIVERSVPVRLTSVGNVPFGYEAADAELDPATVKVSGPSALVRRVEAAALEVRLDAATVDVDGRYTLTPVDGQAQPMVTETRALRMTPGEVHIRIPITQQLSYKTVGVQPDFGGTPQSGFVIGGITAEPATVTIVGAPRALASINFAGTERIDVTNAASTISRQVDVVVPEGLSVLQQDTVHVSVQILPLILSQSFVTVPLPDNLAPNLQITSTLPSVQVVLQGPTNTLQGLRPSDLRTSLNLAGLGSGSQQATVEVSAPAGVTIESVSPRIIAVTLTSTSTPTPVAVATSAPAQESAVFASPDDEEGE